MATPVLGFNNNVRHRGRLFHIQTEDSGVRFARIVTHLFADGGHIIKTTKTDYAEHAEKPDVASMVRTLMKDQHRAMFVALRTGEFDEALERAIGPLPEPLPVPPPTSLPAAASGAATARPPSSAPRRSRPSRPGSDRPKRRPISNPNLHGVAPSVPPPPPEAFDLDVAALELLPPSAGTAVRKSRPPPAPSRTASQRPSAQFAHAPDATARSIFGDGAISEQTLDEVILSYLAEDLDGNEPE